MPQLCYTSGPDFACPDRKRMAESSDKKHAREKNLFECCNQTWGTAYMQPTQRNTTIDVVYT